MESYDAIIVGAGPGGLNCASILGRANLKVLLLEQNEKAGPKVCAGGLTAKALDYLSLPDDLVDFKFNDIVLHTPLNKTRIRSDRCLVATIDRNNLGGWQLERALSAGVNVRLKSKVTEIGKGFVVVDKSERFGYKYLVGADGPLSMVRRSLGLKTQRLIVGVQYIVPAKSRKELEIFYDSRLLYSWYAWVFPHKDYASVGYGYNPVLTQPGMIRENFIKWSARQGIDIAEGEYEAHYINYDYRGYRFGNVFLVGEAAGLTSGLTGEGIYQALISGEEAAKSIIDERYESEKMVTLIKIMEFHDRVMSFIERSGAFRGLEYELIALLFKVRPLAGKVLKILT